MKGHIISALVVFSFQSSTGALHSSKHLGNVNNLPEVRTCKYVQRHLQHGLQRHQVQSVQRLKARQNGSFFLVNFPDSSAGNARLRLRLCATAVAPCLLGRMPWTTQVWRQRVCCAALRGWPWTSQVCACPMPVPRTDNGILLCLLSPFQPKIVRVRIHQIDATKQRVRLTTGPSDLAGRRGGYSTTHATPSGPNSKLGWLLCLSVGAAHHWCPAFVGTDRSLSGGDT